MKTTVATLAVGLGLLALTASQVQASSPQNYRFSIKYTAYRQGLPTVNGTTTTYNVVKSKFTDKDLMAFISENSVPHVDIPDGSYLGLDEAYNLTVYSKSDAVIVVENINDLISYDWNQSVYSGKYDSANDKENTKYYFLSYFDIILGEDAVTTQGFTTESYSYTDDTKPTSTEKESDKATMAGDGTYAGNFTVVTGKLTLKGKLTYSNN